MPHARNRHVLPVLLETLKFSPVVSIQGAWQTGKSFLVRVILPKSLKKSTMVKLDSELRMKIFEGADGQQSFMLCRTGRWHRITVDPIKNDRPRAFKWSDFRLILFFEVLRHV